MIKTGSHIMAAPMTYAIDGEQYVAVQAGYGGTAITVGPIPPSSAARKYQNTNRIIAFKLGGGAVPTPPRARRTAVPASRPQQTANAGADRRRRGQVHRGMHALPRARPEHARRICAARCRPARAFKDIVLHGVLAPAGMERFDDILSEKDVDDIHAYLIDQSWIAYRAQQAAVHR